MKHEWLKTIALALMLAIITAGCGSSGQKTAGVASESAIQESMNAQKQVAAEQIPTEQAATEEDATTGLDPSGQTETSFTDQNVSGNAASAQTASESHEAATNASAHEQFQASKDEAAAEVSAYERFQASEDRALSALQRVLDEQAGRVYVYRDFSDTENHFTQKALMAGYDPGLVHDMDENWQEDPYSGDSCIRCEQVTVLGDWGGWLFLNGCLPAGSSVPELNDGSEDGQGMDLRGARRLRFFAKGEAGGETVEFFTCGFGYDGESGVKRVKYPDSAKKQSLGFVTLTSEWKEYTIDLEYVDTSYVVCGFGYVLSGDKSGFGTKVFYLDEIAFEGDLGEGMHPMLKSYETDNLYIRNAAFSYDNALAAMAFLSTGQKEEAEKLLDSFVYAVENDRYRAGRVRNAYSAGDITAFPGWESGAKLPGWYDKESGMWYEDRYQTGSNVGNTSYVALALLQYDSIYGNEKYRETAAALMDWVLDECGGGDAPGFTGGYDGWPESGSDTTYVFTYKSIEHNIDAYAAFKQLYAVTGDEKYKAAAESALALINSMYDAEQGLFYTGTTEDGVTPNKGNIVLDAQVWACMALGEELFLPYEASLKTVASMQTEEGGYPFCAANENGGWWAEGTAYTALMYRLRGEDAKAEAAMDALEAIQLDSGLFPAATVDDLSTGFELFDGSPWLYGSAPHIAPAAWYIMAAEGFNPYSFK